MIVQIQATAVNAAEIVEKLSPEARAAIKGKKAVAYVIGEEGESRPRVIGEGSQVLRWPRAVIRRLADAVKGGTKFFERHGKDNSHDGRKPLGEIVGSFTRAVGDRLQAVAVGVLNTDRPDLDVCSIEADVQTAGDTVGDVESVTGVALASSREESPAFAGARRLAVLQCFNDSPEGDSIIESGETGKPGEGKRKMPTFEEVKQFVRDHNVYPNQLFTAEDMKNDRVFGPILAEGDAAKEKAKALEAEKADLEKKSVEAIRANEIAAAKGRFEKLIPEGATDKQKAFYMRRFDPSRLEKLDDAALKTYLEAEATEYAETAKLLGVAESTPEHKPGEKSGETDPVEAAFQETTGGKA